MTDIEHEVVRLVCNDEYKPVWEPVVLDELGADQVRVRSELTCAKHGTEMSYITGGAINRSSPYLAKQKVFDRTRSNPADPKAFSSTGQTTVGTVTAVGRDVKHLKEGDRVWGGGRFQTVQQSAGFRKLDGGLTPEAACCVDPAMFALGAVRDGKIRVGDNVIVFGMGAIGLFAVQLARLSGALNVVAVDPLANRRSLALRHGATKAVDPNEVGDFAAASREWFADGADVTIEASANKTHTNVFIN